MQPDESNRRIVFILLRRAPHDVNPTHTESSDFTAQCGVLGLSIKEGQQNEFLNRNKGEIKP